jgi:hypothetical protein
MNFYNKLIWSHKCEYYFLKQTTEKSNHSVNFGKSDLNQYKHVHKYTKKEETKI